MISSMISWGTESMTSWWLLGGLFRLLGASNDNSEPVLSFSHANGPKSLDLRDRWVFMGDDDQMLWCHNQSRIINITTLLRNKLVRVFRLPHRSAQGLAEVAIQRTLGIFVQPRLLTVRIPLVHPSPLTNL